MVGADSQTSEIFPLQFKGRAMPSPIPGGTASGVAPDGKPGGEFAQRRPDPC